MTPWHHDLPYYGVDGSQLCSIWLPLDTVPKAACREFIARSHNSGVLYYPGLFINHSDYAEGLAGFETIPDIDAHERTTISCLGTSPPVIASCSTCAPCTAHRPPPDNRLWINAVTARRIGLVEGEQVELQSPFGRGCVRVHLTEGIHPDVVGLQHGFGAREMGRNARGRGISDNVFFKARSERLSGMAIHKETKVWVSPVAS